MSARLGSASSSRDKAASPQPQPHPTKPSSAHRRGSMGGGGGGTGGGGGAPSAASVTAAVAASSAAAAAAASAPAGPVGAKARKAARDAEERAAREQAAEEVNVHSYNEMLKKLLSKEIAAREVSESKAAESAAALERFKTIELDALRASHQAALAAQAESLSSRARLAFDADIEAAVGERVAAARALDSAKLATQAELQHKLHVEFEDKYSQKLQREQREKKELSERLYTALAKNDALLLESKSLREAIASRDGMVSALEHRCAALEKLKVHLRSYRNLVKFMSCRVFINTVRLKRSLHGVYDSLRVLADKLAENAEYDRTSELILPQHELEGWLAKVEPLVAKPKQNATPMGGFVAAMGGSGGGSGAAGNGAIKEALSHLAANIHPNTVAMNPHFKTESGGVAATAAAAVMAFSGSGGGNNQASGSVVPSSPSMSPSPMRSPRRKAGPRRTASYLPSGAELVVSSATAIAPSSSASGADDADPHGSSRDLNRSRDLSRDRGGGGEGKVVRAPRLGYSISFREMLRAIGEVEVVLRGCLIEALSKAGEWKASSEDFFLRNQELVAENVAMREAARRGAGEVASLQGSLQVLERGAAAASDERKALLEISAQAPGSGTASGGGGGIANGGSSGTGGAGNGKNGGTAGFGSLSQHNHLNHVHSSGRGGSSTAAQRRLTGATMAHGGPDHNGLDKAMIARGTEPHSNLAAMEAHLAGEGKAAQQQAHKRSQRLAALALGDPSAGASVQGGPRGFFEQHHAMMQCCLTQKGEIERLRRANDSARSQNAQLKAALRQAQQEREFAWAIGEGMDREVDTAGSHQSSSSNTAGGRNGTSGETGVAIAERDGAAPISTGEAEEEKEAVQHSPSPRKHTGRSSGVGPPSHPRPSHLDVDDGSNGNRQIRAVIPFSPPVGPVSPFVPSPAAAGTARPHSSAGVAALAASPYASGGGGVGSGANGAYTARSHSGAATPRDLGIQSARSHRSSGGSASGGSSLYTPSRTQSALSARGGGALPPYSDSKSLSLPTRMSPGAALLLAQTQPITTSSQSYASTHVYSPAPHVYTPGPHQHVSTVTGTGSMSARSRTGSGRSARPSLSGSGSASVSAAEVAAATALRTVNPLLAAGLVPSSAVAAALAHTKGVALHPSLQITGDVRYDIISPYIAKPLPWEPREKRPATAAATSSTVGAATAGAASASGGSTNAHSTPSSPSVSSSNGVAERRKRAQEYGRQLQQQHAAQAAAREEKAAQLQHDAMYERPFQSQKRMSQEMHDSHSPIHPASSSSSGGGGGAGRGGRPQSATRMRPHPSALLRVNGADLPSPVAAVSSSTESSRRGSSANSSAPTSPLRSPVSTSNPASPSARMNARKMPIVPPQDPVASTVTAGTATPVGATAPAAGVAPASPPPPAHARLSAASPSRSSTQGSAAPRSSPSTPATDYRSVRTGGPIGQQHTRALQPDRGDEDAAPAATQQRAALNGAAPSLDAYRSDESFDASPSPSRSRSRSARPRASLPARRDVSSGGGGVVREPSVAHAVDAPSEDDDPVYTSDSDMAVTEP